jgi:hypothetical protein
LSTSRKPLRHASNARAMESLMTCGRSTESIGLSKKTDSDAPYEVRRPYYGTAEKALVIFAMPLVSAAPIPV